MKKIIMSLVTISALTAIGVAATGAFFSDEEKSVGNTFQAGAIDLKIDSTAHYAGMVCTEGEWVEETTGSSTRPDLKGAACTGTWTSTDLSTQKFFEYSDLKPEDAGENTMSLTVTTNPSWACAEITVTDDNDMTCTEPEIAAETDPVCSPNTLNSGEMAKNLSFAWWADDGDNILETAEVPTLFFQSGAKLSDLLVAAGGNTLYLTLADSDSNFFTKTAATPLVSGTTYYVGTAWCFGAMAIDTGTAVITCDGNPVSNQSQTDKLTADIKFTAIQERNNSGFNCADTYRPPVAQ